MSLLKQFFGRLALLSLATVLFFIGLGLAVFVTVLLLITRLFVSTKSHESLRQKWQARQQAYRSTVARHRVIDGQYQVVDTP